MIDLSLRIEGEILCLLHVHTVHVYCNTLSMYTGEEFINQVFL